MLKKTEVVLFDFDGTLSGLDSNVAFARYCFRRSVQPWLYLPLMGICGICRWVKPDGVWWRENIRRFLTPKMVKKFAPGFIKQHKRERFGWAKERVQAERDAGRKVLMVSASPDYLLPQLVRDMNFDAVFCSKTYKDKPWKYEFLCWGANKVRIMDEWAAANKIIPHVVRAYSDSKSDMPMMEIADEQVWIDKKTGLRK
ncbi:MAG: HAD-IB family phosphatase [Alphaproteobacteria bacterium]|nr:HAD-IB family phosphatase [Alphaproteobacteria bacterium]